jgi:ABC-type multidrug transport system fused ATPase/permease subunit
VFLVVAINELTPFVVAALQDASTIVFQGRDGVIPIVGDIQGGKKLLSALFTAFSSACKDSWAHLAFASALLSIWSNDVFVRPAVRRTASAVSGHVRDQTSSSQMFLRLVAGLPPRKAMPDVLAQSARRQVWSDVEASRLRSLVGMSTIALIALTVSVAKPIVGAIIGAGVDIASLDAWKWPLEWAVLGQGMKSHLGSMASTIGALLSEEWTKIVDNPLAVVVQASLFVVLFAISTLPTIVRHIEQKKSASDHLDVDAAVKGLGDDEEEYDAERSTAAVLDMGVSSATRLSLLSQPGAVEGVLDRWMLMQPKSSLPRPSAKSRIDSMCQNQGRAGALFRRVAYEASVLALLCIPFAVYVVIAPSASVDVSERWNTGTRLVSLLLVAFTVSRRVLSSIADEFKLTSSVDSFLRLLSGIVAELTQLNQAPDVLQLAAQTSSDNGITVSDFWAAHAQRRAWACRGAQLSCKNGEVCLVLGDDGSGKSRLLAALGETLVSPPTKSRSTVFVRGRINVGGLDVTRWDKKRLKRNLALVLNDVRTLSDTAALFSGLTLQEILDPANGSGGGPGSPSHNAMAIAIQVTGLSSLVARLPSKLSTVVTASEDELSPSPTRPSAQILSPSEWNKVLLARSIAQTVLGNDNPMTAPDAVQGSLIGSLLLLDDVTTYANEVEEAELIKALRATGAATLLTSNHWASGRHANRIVVMKDGAVVESGSHAELMQRGPANSVYALRWKQMTSGV